MRWKWWMPYDPKAPGTEAGETPRSRKELCGLALKRAVLYALVPALILRLLAEPVRNAGRAADASVFIVLGAALAATGANWLVYALIHRRRLPLPILAHGSLCMLAVVVMLQLAMPGHLALSPILAYIGAFLVMGALLPMSYWFAARSSKPAHVAAVGARLFLIAMAFGMTIQVLRDVEARLVSRDTWITVGFLVILVLGLNARKIRFALRRDRSRRQATGLAAGKIVQIIGETFMDPDGDTTTRNRARIRYTVDGASYETRAAVSRFITRKYGKEAFVGREIPVYYDPADPARAFAGRIDRHLVEEKKDEDQPPAAV